MWNLCYKEWGHRSHKESQRLIRKINRVLSHLGDMRISEREGEKEECGSQQLDLNIHYWCNRKFWVS